MDFYFPYEGNKKSEINNIDEFIDLNLYNTICEPFGGSLAFSRYCYKHNENLKFIINDIRDDLTFLCNNLHKFKDEVVQGVKDKIKELDSKDKYDLYVKYYQPTNDIETMIKILHDNKNYCLHKGVFPKNRKVTLKDFDNRTKNTDSFFKKHTYLNKDYHEILESVKNDDKTLVFLDPPYLLSSEGFYNGNKDEEIWRYLFDFCKTCKCKFIMIIDGNFFMKEIFKGLIKKEYEKLYQITKKKTSHIVVSNI